LPRLIPWAGARLRGLFLAGSLLGAVLIGWGYLGSVRASQEATAQATLEYVQQNYTSLQLNWQRNAEELKAQIDFMRVFAANEPRPLMRLRAYFSAMEGKVERFPSGLVLNARGDVVFSFGMDGNALEPALKGGQALPPLWVDERRGEVHHVLAVPLWLGAEGQGRLVLMQPMGNAVMRQLAPLETKLLLVHQGRVLASSEGSTDVGSTLDAHFEGRLAGAPAIHYQLALPAFAQAPSGPRLVMQQQMIEPLPTSVLIGAGTLLLAILAQLLWLRSLNLNLEQRVAERTAELARRNAELARALDELQQTRDELVESAKLAALGSMVAGIAHELNTPIGNGLTVASTLAETSQAMRQSLEAGIKRSSLQAFLNDAVTAGDILQRNLERAATLIASFKQVAVDQTSSQRRKFQLHDTLAEVLLALSPSLKSSGCAVRLQEIDGDIQMDSYPGPLGQVLANLVNNCLTHGYADQPPGEVRIKVARQGEGQVSIDVADDGAGIAAEHQSRIFEPFFTTRLGKGGSGLGLSIVRNIVTATLGGRIEVISALGEGTTVRMTLPLQAPLAD
jgi:signal transduction histidine kinase